MGQILAITRKEILHWAQKPGSWVTVFLLPFLFIWIMQAVFGSGGNPVISFYAVNQDESPQAEQVLEALRGSANLHVEILDTREEADRLVGQGERMAALIIPPGFGLDLNTPEGAELEIIIDPAREEQAGMVIGLVNAALGPMMVDAEVSRGVQASVRQVIASVDTSGLPQDPNNPLVNIDMLREFFTYAVQGVVSNQVRTAMEDPQVRLDVQPYAPAGIDPDNLRPPTLLDYLVPGYSLMFMFFLISNLARTVVEERQTGTLRRLLVAPLPRSRILIGKMLPYFLIGAVQMTFVLLLSTLMFGIDLGNSPVGLAMIIFASALVMAALGILIAAFARTEGHADGLAIILVLAMAVVSGAMFPSIQIAGLQQVTPHYWSMQGFLNLMARGMGPEGAFLPVGVLLTMAALFFTIGAVRFRFE